MKTEKVCQIIMDHIDPLLKEQNFTRGEICAAMALAATSYNVRMGVKSDEFKDLLDLCQRLFDESIKVR